MVHSLEEFSPALFGWHSACLVATYFQGPTGLCGRYIKDILIPADSSTCNQASLWDGALENLFGHQCLVHSARDSFAGYFPAPGMTKHVTGCQTLGPESFPFSGMGQKGRCVMDGGI